MAEFFKSSSVWVVDFHYEGRPRRWFKALPTGADAHRVMTDTLRSLYEGRAVLQSVRPATEAEERQYLRGEEPLNAYCPTLRAPRRGRSS